MNMTEWIASKPECVRKLIDEFPPFSVFALDGVTWYLIGWTESDRLIVSRVDPHVDYETAMASREHICAQHLRDKGVVCKGRFEYAR